MDEKELSNPQKRKRTWEVAEDFKKPKLEEGNQPCAKEQVGDLNETAIPSEKKGNFCEVFRLVFNYVDMKRLKILRPVCKSWNREACLVLQRRSYTSFHENETKEFKKLLTQNKDLSLPSPFKSFHVQASKLRNEYLTPVIGPKESELIKLAITEQGCCKEESPGTFHSILKSKGATLTHLRFEGINFRVKKHQIEKVYTGSPSSARSTPTSRTFVYYKNEVEYRREWIRSTYFQFYPTNSEEEAVQLPVLEYFGFSNLGVNEEFLEEENIGTEIVTLIASVINSTRKLQTLHFSRVDINILEQIFSFSKLSSITAFHAECITDDHLLFLSALELPYLKSLTLKQDDKLCGIITLNRSVSVDNELLSVIENFASSINELDLTWNWSSFDFESVRCPQLKTLRLKSSHCPLDNLECFTDELFPELEEVAVDRYYPYRCSEFAEDPHDGVRRISVDASSRGPDHLEPLMSSLQQKFPSAVSFAVKLGGSSACNAKIIKCLGDHFPKLQSLSLDSPSVLDNCTACLGISEDVLKTASDQDVKEKVFNEMSILRFKSLSKLMLGSSIQITDDIVQFGISKIPSLKSFGFFWPESALSVQMISTHLQHLIEITVNNCCTPPNSVTLDDLFLKLDSLKCGCKNQRNFIAPFDHL